MDKKTLIYEFGEFRMDLEQRLLVRSGESVLLTPKGFDTLLFLVQNRGRVLEKEELMGALWPESIVEESNLSQNIFVLRKILGDDQNGNRFIQTIPRRGYKFVASVKETDVAAFGNCHPGERQNNFDSLQRDHEPEEVEHAAEFLQKQPIGPSATVNYWSQHSPFRGLQVFEPEDSWLFFGRDSDTDELLVRLSRSSVLVIVGNSGSGKSSLVRAGLIPALRQGRFRWQGSSIDSWRIALFRPSGSPFDSLAEILPSALAPELSLKEQAEFIEDCRSKLPLGGNSLRNAISVLGRATAPVGRHDRVLLIADQFEEIFTLSPNREVCEKYIDALLVASRLDGAIPVHLVVVVRADFYANCLEHAALSHCLGTNLYNVPRMTREQLGESIEKRLTLATALAEPGLIDSLLEEVGAEPGNLALLEHALSQLWEKCGGFGTTLTNRAYSAIGRLRGALSAHADDVYGEITAEVQKHLVQKIFLELVHLGEGAPDSRRRVRKRELLSLGVPEEVEYLLARLTSSRLISISTEGQETLVEVSHEALIREWETLREWITQNREELRLGRRLVQAAQEWDGLNRDRTALLQGARLSRAEEWLTRHDGAPTLLHTFLRESTTARSEAVQKEGISQAREYAERKALNVRLGWVFRAVALLLVLVVAAIWISLNREEALDGNHLSKQSLLAPFEDRLGMSPIWLTYYLTCILLQCVACWAVIKKEFYKSWRAFSFYLFFEAVSSVVLFVVFLLVDSYYYSIIYTMIKSVETIVASLFVLEILIKILDRIEAMPGRKIAWFWFCFWPIQGISVAIAISTNQPSVADLYWLAVFWKASRIIFVANYLLLLVVLLQAKSLGMTRRSSVTEIAVGYAMYGTFEVVYLFSYVFYRTRFRESIMNVVDLGVCLANLTVQVGWVWTMLHREPFVSPAFEEISNRTQESDMR